MQTNIDFLPVRVWKMQHLEVGNVEGYFRDNFRESWSRFFTDIMNMNNWWIDIQDILVNLMVHFVLAYELQKWI